MMGIILILVGALLLMNPLSTILAAEVLMGWVFLAVGIAHLFVGFDGKRTASSFIRALIYIGVGILIIGTPFLVAVSLPVLLGIFLVVEGIFVMILSLLGSGQIKGWGLMFVLGILSLVFGVVILSNPLLALSTLVILFSAYLIALGLVTTFTRR